MINPVEVTNNSKENLMPEYLSLHQCYNKIVKASERTTGSAKLIDYAATYANYGRSLPDARVGDKISDEVRIQALYVRNNLGSWRHPEAKLVRSSIDKILK